MLIEEYNFIWNNKISITKFAYGDKDFLRLTTNNIRLQNV
jgi:hypothetical protein